MAKAHRTGWPKATLTAIGTRGRARPDPAASQGLLFLESGCEEIDEGGRLKGERLEAPGIDMSRPAEQCDRGQADESPSSLSD
jgi:hypothetical protein